MEVTINLDPEVVGCSNVTADDTNCIATITNNENYTVSLTVTNDLDSTTLQKTFDCELCVATCKYSDTCERQNKDIQIKSQKNCYLG